MEVISMSFVDGTNTHVIKAETPEEAIKYEAMKIMRDKLKEMSALTISDFCEDVAAYNGLCYAMCDIYRALANIDDKKSDSRSE